MFHLITCCIPVAEISINEGSSQEKATYNIVDKAKYEQKNSIKCKHPKKVSDLHEAHILFHVSFFCMLKKIN
jgi:mRNA-degrading endonuclease HigB of HigAB toxin-antitoxin module